MPQVLRIVGSAMWVFALPAPGNARVGSDHQGFWLYACSGVSEQQIRQWADEAEQGYDVEELQGPARGRPSRGAEPMQVVALRLTAEELHALDTAAAKRGYEPVEAMGAALAPSLCEGPPKRSRGEMN